MRSQETLADITIRSLLSHAREAEHLGDYDRAARLLEDYWLGLGTRPHVEDLDAEAGAEVLLRAGALTGYLGSKAQAPDAQEHALDLLSESHRTFSTLGLASRVAEVQIEQAACYRRQGAYAEARAMLDGAAEMLGTADPYLCALAAVRRIIVEISEGKLEEAARLLGDAGRLVNQCDSLALRGRHLNECGALVFFMSEKGGPPRWEEALNYFIAAKECVELAGDLRYTTIAENNIGFALIKLGRLSEARRHIVTARRLALCVDDQATLALIDDTEAQLLMEQNQLVEAEAISRARIEEMEGTDHLSLLAENLTTHAVALARLGMKEEAAEEFRRAIKAAEFIGDTRWVEQASSLRDAELVRPRVLPFRRNAKRSVLSFEWRVADDSLCDIGIRKGNAVRFTVSSRGRDGDLVAVLVQGGRFVKLAYMEPGGHVRLEGAHPRCPVRRVARAEVNILGVAGAQPN